MPGLLTAQQELAGKSQKHASEPVNEEKVTRISTRLSTMDSNADVSPLTSRMSLEEKRIFED